MVNNRPPRSARQIDAKKSVPLEQKPKARKIFVGGLAPETTEGTRNFKCGLFVGC